MADPLTIATVGVSLIGGLFGNEKTESGMTLPPTLQLEMLQGARRSFEMLQKNMASVDDIVKAYDERIDLISKGIQNTIPESEVLEQLTNNSAKIALGLGADAQQLIEDGFLDQDDIERIEALDQLNDQEFVDQQFEQEFSQQRAALEQQLMRDGRSMAEISQTLMQFDSQKAVERQQRGESLRTGAFNRGLATLQAQSGLRQQNFNNALQGFNAQQQVLGNAQNQFGNLANIAGQQAQMNFSGMNQQVNMAGARQSLFNSLGQFKLSQRLSEEAMTGSTRGWDALMAKVGEGPFGGFSQRLLTNADAKGKIKWD